MTRPRLGFTPATPLTPAEMVTLARDAETWGYQTCWGAEVDGPDAFTVLGAVAAATDLELGVAVVPVQTRSAFVLAMSALSLSSLSGGRFLLGIGASSDVLVERFGGVPYERPLTWLRETIAALRPALAGERATVDGERVRIGGYRSPIAPAGPTPLLLGSLNPASLRLAGELADGICLNQMRVGHLPAMLAEVRAGADAAGRALPEDFPVMGRLFCAVTDAPDAVKAFIPHVFAPYVLTRGYARFYRWQGYGAAVEAIAAAGAARDKAAMAAAYTPDIVDDLFLVGTASEVVDRIEAFGAAGLTHVGVMPLAADTAGARDTLAAIATEWARRS